MSASPARRMRFGIQLQPQRTTWAEYIEAVRAVEDIGFDSVWNADHLLPYNGPDDGTCFETWTTLAAMAAATSRIHIGSLVNGVMYRDPATLVKSATTVDLISNGRLCLAMGAAWAEREFREYGLPFPPIGERIGRLDETLTIVKQLWTQPRTTFTGRFYHIEDAPCEPKPVQRPHPPIIVGGNGRATLRLTAKHADIWNGNRLSARGTVECVSLLRDACREIGRKRDEVELTMHGPMAIAGRYDIAETAARAVVAIEDRQLDDERDLWLLGTPDDIRNQLRRYADAGITQWIMATAAPFDLNALRLFADEVMPAFR